MIRPALRIALSVTLAVCALNLSACKKPSPEVQQLVQQISGTWVNRQPGSYYTTLIVLQLNENGRYTMTTYGEINGERQPMFIHQYTADAIVTGDEAMIKKLKAEGYKEAVETGRFSVSVEQGTRQITMNKDNPTDKELQAGMDVQTFNLNVMPERKQIQIGPKAYTREQATQ
jgi:hypothetical protein